MPSGTVALIRSPKEGTILRTRTKAIIAGAAIAAASITGAGIAIGAGEDDDDSSDQPITGVELERASEAALNFTGEGTVTDTEIEDEESYYEVEVTLDDGSQVDVQLDEGFNVVGSEADDEFPVDGEDD